MTFEDAKDAAVIEAIQKVFENPFIQVAGILLAILLVQIVSGFIVQSLVRRLTPYRKFASKEDEQKREDTLINIFKTAIAAIVWVVGALLILTRLGMNLAALATGAGLFGIIIGFGAQNTIKDFLAGFFIILENQYRVGDIVSLNVGGTEVAGVVENLSVRITRLRDLDGNLHIVQNGSAIAVTNLSIGFANVNVDVRVSYETDISKVEKIINQVGDKMAADNTWKKDTIEPIQYLRVDSFGETAVNIKALGKVQPGRQWDVAGEFRRRLMEAFEKHGIEIPLPQMTVRSREKRVPVKL